MRKHARLLRPPSRGEERRGIPLLEIHERLTEFGVLFHIEYMSGIPLLEMGISLLECEQFLHAQ